MTSPPPAFGNDQFLEAIARSVRDAPGHIVMLKVNERHMKAILYGLRELLLCDSNDRSLPAGARDEARALLASFADLGGVAYTD